MCFFAPRGGKGWRPVKDTIGGILLMAGLILLSAFFSAAVSGRAGGSCAYANGAADGPPLSRCPGPGRPFRAEPGKRPPRGRAFDRQGPVGAGPRQTPRRPPGKGPGRFRPAGTGRGALRGSRPAGYPQARASRAMASGIRLSSSPP